MDKTIWIERFVARMLRNDPALPEPQLMQLGLEAFSIGGHLSPETVARIETDIASHRLKARPGPLWHLRSRLSASRQAMTPESKEPVVERGRYATWRQRL